MNNNDIVPSFDEEKDESLRIKLEKVEGVEGCLVLYLGGYIDTYNSNFFQKRINRAVESGFIRLIFNCGGLNYVSSTGIGSFTAFLKAVKPRGGDLVLLETGLPPWANTLVYLPFLQLYAYYRSLSKGLNPDKPNNLDAVVILK